ncbi:SDR family NAD(P)-dependent oxidoreductase, partial [Streptomyces goshikiensis]
MDLELTDKVAVVTGASKGIGLAITESFLREGARVVAGSRSETRELAALRETYDVAFVAGDLATGEGVDALIQAAMERHGRIDILVNNVGATEPRTDFLAIDDAQWQRGFELNFFSAVRASRAALPHLLADGGGAVVNISSINARLPFPSVVDYSAA